MIQKISRLFCIKLNEDGKKKINNWINTEFGSLYYAKKILLNETDITDFINDMLQENKLQLTDLGMLKEEVYSNRRKKKNKSNTISNHIKYCPYCGKFIGNMNNEK
jgi:hypothetical protein